MSFQKEITPELAVLAPWEQGLTLQDPVFELNYWIPGKRGDVYEGAVVSRISLISSLNMPPWNEQVGTTAHWSSVEWYNLQNLFFRQVYAEACHLKKCTHREATDSVHAWTITQILTNYYTHLCCQLLFCLLWMLLLPVKGKKATNN